MPEDSRSAQELYDDTASGWVRRQPLSLSDFTGRPPTLALCEPISGARVLDLGCGEGYCARHLRRAGARDVLAIDVSTKMIQAAVDEERREPLGIHYAVGDASDLSSVSSGDRDLVIAMFLFNYLGVDDTVRCMREVARVLRPGGKFVFAVPHPSFAFIREPSPPFLFERGGAGYFTARDRRLPGKIWKRDGSALEVQSVHKTFEDYFRALRAAGFTTLPIVRELHVTPEILAVDPPFFGPLGEAPLHLAIALSK